MLDINVTEFRQGFLKYLPAGLFVAVIFFIELFAAMYVSIQNPSPLLQKSAVPLAVGVSNTRAIGNVLYTDYAYLFQTAGLILLVAMIGAITLTHRRRPGVRRQNIGKQVERDRKKSIELVSVKSGEGAA